MSSSLRRSKIQRPWIALGLALVAGLAACGKDCGRSGEQPPAPVAPAPAALTTPKPEPQPEAAPKNAQKVVIEQAPPMADKPSADPVGFPKAGWNKVVLDDQVPLCLFANYEQHWEAKFFKDVKPQTLKAGTPIVVGAFGPYCINESCDDLPSLQCEATLEGKTIVVKTHYWAYHKEGSSCTGLICRQVNAGCKTPELSAGKYKIKHGDRTWDLKIPSTLPKPCFGDELQPPPAATGAP